MMDCFDQIFLGRSKYDYEEGIKGQNFLNVRKKYSRPVVECYLPRVIAQPREFEFQVATIDWVVKF